MQIFINELSLESQYHTDLEFKEAIESIANVLELLQKKIPDKKFYRGASLLQREAIANQNWQSAFARLPMPLQERFKRLAFQGSNDWQPNSIQDNQSNYFYIDFQNFGNSIKANHSTLAEVAEHLLQNSEQKYIVINFVDSRFSQKDLATIIKIHNNEQKEIVDILVFDNLQTVETWLELEYAFSRTEYDYNSSEPPTDMQTILRDTNLFKPTVYKCQGRIIHENIETGHYWYVDNFHNGKGSHLEVFHVAEDKHLGEADLDGNIDYSKTDARKKIKRYLK